MSQAANEWIPVTAEDKEYLGEYRNRALKRWKKLSIIASVVSIISIGIGIAVIVMSDYFYFKVGGPLITASLTLILVLVSIGAIYEGRKYPRGDETGGCFQCWVTCYLLLVIFCIISVLCPLIFTIIAVVSCASDEESEDSYTTKLCDKNREILFALSILSLLFILILTILNFIGGCTYCWNTRAFGMKGRNEQLLETQMLMLSELQRQQMQAAGPQQGPAVYPPAANTGWYPGTQPMQGQFSPRPTAPPARYEEPVLSGYSEREHNFDARHARRKVPEELPPSYNDVMKK